jgi:HPt (histidine-containing phosphotransfer) domain-containing protein
MADIPSSDPLRRDVLDPQVVEDMFNLPGRTGPSLFLEILALFRKSEPARIADLTRLVAERQGAELERQAHQVAGSCAVIGALQLQDAARRLEDAAREGDWAAVAEKLAALNRDWAALQAELAKRKLV